MRAVMVLVVLVRVASAQPTPSTSPGVLAKVHASLACADCHTAGNTLSGTLCLACHPALDARIASQQGFHASTAVAGKVCESCHHEHHGSSYDVRGWRAPSGGESGFDHRSAGWVLVGKHGVIPCADCHTRVDGQGLRTYLGLAPGEDCRGCHTHANVHDGRWSSRECAKCHGSTPSPTPPGSGAPFTPVVARAHGPSSNFPLVKRHEGIPCTDCHHQNTTRFADLSPRCGGCHEDILHNGSLGAACTRCHVSGTWQPSRFDHDRTYALRGAHRTTACEGCHPAKDFATAPTACGGCHEDAHRGHLGTACERCHEPTGDITFDHQAKSTYRLDGKHLAVACADCHPSRTFAPRPTTCEGCHPDPHLGRRGHACEACHTTRTFARLR